MRSRALLILSVIAVVAIWQLPYGRQILYPLTLLAAYVHEMGHGLAALVLGQSFDQLYLYANGSGMAYWHGQPGAWVTALIAAGGLGGPTLAGVALILAASAPRWARVALAVLSVAVIVSVALWVRNLFGIAFLLALAAFLGLSARFLTNHGAQALVMMISVTLCLSWFSDLRYMFSAYAEVNGIRYPSDSMQIAQALLLPYWFWGGVVALMSLTITVLAVLWVDRSSARS